MALNPAVTFFLGVLSVIVLAGGVYIYYDFTRSEKTIANYSASNVDGDSYIYDDENEMVKDAIDDSISGNLDEGSIPTDKGVITGKLCYPSDFLPEGEVVVKNTLTNTLTIFPIDGESSEFKIQVEPGTYNIRYQAHASGDQPDLYTSGYYTKCAINSDVDVCEADDGHELIPVTISAGKVLDNITLCDFYYPEEPDF